MLRRRLGVPEGAIFDKVLAKKLRTFQAEHGLPDDAIAGSATIAALNRGPAYYERLIQLNMERARVLPGPWTRHSIDRKSVVQGKGVSGRVGFGGRRIIKKKKYMVQHIIEK